MKRKDQGKLSSATSAEGSIKANAVEAALNAIVRAFEREKKNKRITIDKSMSKFTGKRLEDDENEERENDVSSTKHDDMKSEND